MKDDIKNWHTRDISGTVCGPNAVLSWLWWSCWIIYYCYMS